MKVERAECVKLLKALGFEKASDWSDEKLLARVQQVPTKVAEKEVPEGFEEFYKKLASAEGVELNGNGAVKPTEEVKAKKPKGEPKKEKPAKAVKKEGKAKAKKAPADKSKGRLKGVSEKVTEYVKARMSFDTIFDKLKDKYPVSRSWLLRVVESKQKALKKAKA